MSNRGSYDVLPESSKLFWSYIVMELLDQGEFTMEELVSIIRNLIRKEVK